jgi:SEC-C motif domain protein
MTTAALPLSGDDRCPCLSGETYGGCCGRFHAGEGAAPTAEALMRSRYSAFVVRDAPYLLHTWHPRTRPAALQFDADVQWRRLDIVEVIAGGPFDAEGTVAFQAHSRRHGRREVLVETSRFVRVNRRWHYLDALQAETVTRSRAVPGPGRT